MKVTMEQVREKYPNPVEEGGRDFHSEDEYCVGGALCRFIGITDDGFPKESVAIALKNIVGMPWDIAIEFTSRIFNFNDHGEFEAAWRALDEALSWTPEKTS